MVYVGTGKRWEFYGVDKSEFGFGPWQYEPDKVQWVDQDTGLDCLIVRNYTGVLCGYVGIPPGHPWFGIPRNHCTIDCGMPSCLRHAPEALIDIHGGITYSDANSGGPNFETFINIIPFRDRPKHIWFFGFDCGHAGDFVPRYPRLLGTGEYRDIDYVGSECRNLARQLYDIAPNVMDFLAGAERG